MAEFTITSAWGPMVGSDSNGTSRVGTGYQRYAVTNAAATQILTTAATAGTANASVSKFARHAIVTVNGSGGVRLRDDGTDPTTSEGRFVPDQTTLVFENGLDQLRATRLIGVTGTVEVTVSYYY